MKKRVALFGSSMAFNIIGSLVLMLIAFGLIVSVLGTMSVIDIITREYAVSTYHMADTATALINADHLDDYLAGERMEEYEKARANLDTFCRRMSVSLIYLIKVDTSDYGRFVSIFNAVDNSVDDSSYTPWELGFKRNTTNEEYREKYRQLYAQEALYETVYRVKTTDGQHPHITTLAPVKNSAGEVVAIICVQRPVRELNEARMPYLITIAVSTFLLAVLVSVFIALFIRNQVVRPIRKVGLEATRFAKENTKGEPLGAISPYRELCSLADSVDRMESDTLKYMDNLTAITAEKQRIDTELHMATQIQESMLPCVFPPYPGRSEFDIFATMNPAREVGGDFYDFFLIDGDHLCLVMADVSGKGVPAALFMMISKIIIQSYAQLKSSAAEILCRTNDVLSANNKMEMFVTVWVGILEISTGKLTAANAGHEYPVLCRRGEGFALYKDRHGIVIGGIPKVKYKQYELQLAPGDKLFLYTDGVPEATNAKNEMFGTGRMVGALNAAPNADAKTILFNVKSAVDDFVQDAEQFDDMTMLCLEYRGPQAGEEARRNES